MTTRHQIEFGTVSLFAASAVLGIFLALSINHQPKISKKFSLPVIDTQQIFPTSTPTPAPAIVLVPKVERFSQLSPDGTKKLTMRVTSQAGSDTKTYSFTTSAADDTNFQEIYTVTLPTSENMSIPFNTWSPDDTYVFLQHNLTVGTEALV